MLELVIPIFLPTAPAIKGIGNASIAFAAMAYSPTAAATPTSQKARELVRAREPDTEECDGEARDPDISPHPCPCCGDLMRIIETFERGCAPEDRHDQSAAQQYRGIQRTEWSGRYLRSVCPQGHPQDQVRQPQKLLPYHWIERFRPAKKTVLPARTGVERPSPIPRARQQSP